MKIEEYVRNILRLVEARSGDDRKTKEAHFSCAFGALQYAVLDLYERDRAEEASKLEDWWGEVIRPAFEKAIWGF